MDKNVQVLSNSRSKWKLERERNECITKETEGKRKKNDFIRCNT